VFLDPCLCPILGDWDDLSQHWLAQFIMRLQKNPIRNSRAATMIDLKQKYDASTVAVMRQAMTRSSRIVDS
jgi:hypothetical protein